jgi:hypothetical protein
VVCVVGRMGGNLSRNISTLVYLMTLFLSLTVVLALLEVAVGEDEAAAVEVGAEAVAEEEELFIAAVAVVCCS